MKFTFTIAQMYRNVRFVENEWSNDVTNVKAHTFLRGDVHVYLRVIKYSELKLAYVRGN